jgi:hypothetical protein
LHLAKAPFPLLHLIHSLVALIPLLLYHLVGPRIIPLERVLVTLSDPIVIQLHVTRKLTLGLHTQQGFLRLVISLRVLSIGLFSSEVSLIRELHVQMQTRGTADISKAMKMSMGFDELLLLHVHVRKGTL